ncbi:MAG: ATP-binding protein [Bacteroidota bacterium]
MPFTHLKIYFIVCSCLVISACCWPVLVRAQTVSLDSLEKVLKNHSKKDTGRTILLAELAVRNVYRNPDKAQAYVSEALSLAKEINDQHRLALALQVQASIYLVQGKLAESLEYQNQSIEVASQTREPWGPFQIASSKGDIGSIAVYHNDYAEGIKLYLESKDYFEKTDSWENHQTLHAIYQNIYGVYDQLGDTLNQRIYLDKAFALARGMKDSGLLLWDTKTNISLLLEAGNTKQAGELLQNFRELYTNTGSFLVEEEYHHLMGLYYKEKMDYEKSAAEFSLANQVSEKFNNNTALTRYDYYMADVLLLMNKPEAAKIHATRHLDYGVQNQRPQQLSEGYLLLSRVAEAQGDMTAAFEQYKLSVQYQDTVNFVSQQRQILYAQARYNAEKKQQQIAQLQIEKQQQQLTIKRSSLLAIVLAISTVVLLVIYLLLRRNSGQKQLIQQRRIQELETEKKLTVTEALLRGEEQERRRLAKDLHDGLGGSLSGIKYALGNMKQNVIMTPENQLSLERTIDMLDASIQELRRVAHNMMPESLVRFGLDAALRDFCAEINSSGIIKTVYQSFDLDQWQPDATTALTLYRIVQELVNNTIKHAGARQVIIQLVKENNRVSITVEDDGHGFDTALLTSGKGIGWSNISSRVEYLKGEMELHSTPGKGTSINIYVPL